ncbi:hypothetical protein A2801_03650 [Candidatus Woesebacteria bacterium RIFCSPHIGHO2_01_FULL_41_10]|uniref:Uncharacterized protein n=1 Tax=Candidatus Woesebacteria bacterium RIFCSPHIGHO2_01_FULL_41_10 TaxID=1802500 RepID=A0A1F7YMG6_9BACT|nr:MAG: hypothetical protein A2801_03650 [Candidatus Woesebacteria bacterium RIFCSPHIGHO2_01_FULL_41_10]
MSTPTYARIHEWYESYGYATVGEEVHYIHLNNIWGIPDTKSRKNLTNCLILVYRTADGKRHPVIHSAQFVVCEVIYLRDGSWKFARWLNEYVRQRCIKELYTEHVPEKNHTVRAFDAEPGEIMSVFKQINQPALAG